MYVYVLATWIRLWCLFLHYCLGWSSGPGELSWSATKASHCLFPCSVLSSLHVPANLSCLLCPTAVTFPGFLPALGQEVKVQRVSSRKGKPIIIIFTAPQHQISLCCAPVGLHCQYRFSCPSSEADGLQTAISWTPAPSFKLQAFLLVITDIN